MSLKTRGGLKPTREVIEWANDKLGLSYEQIGDILGVGRTTIYRWTHEEEAVPRQSNFLEILQLQKLKYLMNSVFSDAELRDEWLYYPSPDFDGDSPIQKLYDGDIEPLIKQLATFESGTFC